jgi:hypothetical protein
VLANDQRELDVAALRRDGEPPRTAPTLVVRAAAFVSPTDFLTSAAIFFSAAAVNFFSAKEVGHMAPSSRFAVSLKPSVAYLDLNLFALWKKRHRQAAGDRPRLDQQRLRAVWPRTRLSVFRHRQVLGGHVEHKPLSRLIAISPTGMRKAVTVHRLDGPPRKRVEPFKGSARVQVADQSR